MNILRAISGGIALYADIQPLAAAVQTELNDPGVKAEIAANPAVAAIVARISAEWRAVEDDVTGVHQANLFTFTSRVSALLTAAKKLEADAQAEQHDPAIAAALVSMPKTLAALSVISAQWIKIEADLKDFS